MTNVQMQAPQSAHHVSIVVPFYNEESNIAALCARTQECLQHYHYPWELILVDDGSSDATLKRMREAVALHGAHIHIVELQRNFGQTAAMQAGMDAAQGDLIVTLDGDLQNDPADIPAMVEQLLNEDLDLLVGWRKNRQDKLLLRKVPSFFANRLIRAITKVYLHDYGCSLKVYRTDVIRSVRLYGEMHRFIPAWVATSVSPSRIGECVVAHNARFSGVSKYGISRTFRVILDLLFMWFFMRYRARPGHFFGSIGLILGAVGSVIMLYLGFDKLVMGNDIGGRPLLWLGTLLVLSSIQFITIGILAEILTRIYYESSNRTSYTVRGNGNTERQWFAAIKPQAQALGLPKHA